MSDTNTQTAGDTEAKTVNMFDEPPLVNGQSGESVSIWLHNIHQLIRPTMEFWQFSPVE